MCQIFKKYHFSFYDVSQQIIYIIIHDHKKIV